VCANTDGGRWAQQMARHGGSRTGSADRDATEGHSQENGYEQRQRSANAEHDQMRR
jgi:hypothetical protein